MLCYLALEGPQTRRELAELFFLDSKHPRNALSTTFRRLQGDNLVVADGDRVETTVACDASELLQELDEARAADRRSQVGSGDRSERIRTYNFPQGRVTDHRINLTLYKLDRVITGELLDEVIDPLIAEEQAGLLAELQ